MTKLEEVVNKGGFSTCNIKALTRYAITNISNVGVQRHRKIENGLIEINNDVYRGSRSIKKRDGGAKKC